VYGGSDVDHCRLPVVRSLSCTSGVTNFSRSVMSQPPSHGVHSASTSDRELVVCKVEGPAPGDKRHHAIRATFQLTVGPCEPVRMSGWSCRECAGEIGEAMRGSRWSGVWSVIPVAQPMRMIQVSA